MSAPAVLRGWTPVRVRRSGARMIAWSVAERVAIAVGEPRKHDRVLTEPFERLEHARILESKPFGRRRPVRHRDAVRHVGEGEAEGRGAAARRGKRGRHRIQGREGDHRAHPSQERASRDVLARHNHGWPFSVTLRDWNGRLFTISRTRPENRYSCRGRRPAIRATV